MKQSGLVGITDMNSIMRLRGIEARVAREDLFKLTLHVCQGQLDGGTFSNLFILRQ